MSDRILVMREGRQMAHLRPREATQEVVLAAAMGQAGGGRRGGEGWTSLPAGAASARGARRAHPGRGHIRRTRRRVRLMRLAACAASGPSSSASSSLLAGHHRAGHLLRDRRSRTTSTAASRQPDHDRPRASPPSSPSARCWSCSPATSTCRWAPWWASSPTWSGPRSRARRRHAAAARGRAPRAWAWAPSWARSTGCIVAYGRVPAIITTLGTLAHLPRGAGRDLRRQDRHHRGPARLAERHPRREPASSSVTTTSG